MCDTIFIYLKNDIFTKMYADHYFLIDIIYIMFSSSKMYNHFSLCKISNLQGTCFPPPE